MKAVLIMKKFTHTILLSLSILMLMTVNIQASNEEETLESADGTYKKEIKQCDNIFVVNCYAPCGKLVATGKYKTKAEAEEVSCEQLTKDNSLIDNLTYNYHHFATDYSVVQNSTSCASCVAGGLTNNDLPELNVTRFFRSRDRTQQSSFGAGGWLWNFDINLSLYEDPDSLEVRVDMFDPTFISGVIRFYLSGDHFQDTKWTNSKYLELLDINGLRTTILADAVTAKILTRTETLLTFEIFDLDTGLRSGRLISIKDPRDYGIDIDYVHAATAVTTSNDEKWQVSKVTDANNRELTVTYLATQRQGNWVVETITCPDGNTITYNWGTNPTDSLQGITHRDGGISSFSISALDGNLLTREFFDHAAEGRHRRKKVFLGTNLSVFSGITYDHGVKMFNSSSEVVYKVENGESERSYEVFATGNDERDIYEGGGKVKQLSLTSAKYFEDGETRAQEEPTGAEIRGSTIAYRNGIPEKAKKKDGRLIQYLYDSNQAITEVKYPGGKTETFTNNQFQQTLTHQDREGRETHYTYDAQSNITKKEVGILYGVPQVNAGIPNGNDEYAVYEWAYYPAGHQNQYLLHTATDAEGNVTEYIYNVDNLLIEIKEPDDTGTGFHTAATFTHDSAGRVKTSTDAENRTTTFDYDARGRLIKTTYNDGSTELVFFGTGNDANLPVKTKDRDGNVTKMIYDLEGRLITRIVAYSTMEADGSNEDINDGLDAHLQSVTTYAYLDGTHRVIETITNGDKTEYEYDYRHRRVKTIKHPRNGQTLESTSTYVNNLLFSTEDPYGRKTYRSYRSSDSVLIKTIQGTVPSYSLADYDAVNAEIRDLNNNANHLITEYVLDYSGLTKEVIDPRGIRHKTEYDSRGRTIRQTSAADTLALVSETDYDDESNVIETRSPRHFAETGDFKTTYTYTRRNLLETMTVADNTADAATMSYTYYDDGRAKDITDFRGNTTTSIWHQCCGRIQAQVDELGHGFIYNNTFANDQTHIINVENVLGQSNYHNPDNATTLNETTIRYDERHRIVAQTQWLTPPEPEAGESDINANNPPIAEGTTASQGLTTYYTYYDEASTATEPAISNTLDKLGVGYFGANQTGSAVMVTNPEGERSVSISDGMGRTVITAVIKDDDSVLTWSSTAYDATEIVGGQKLLKTDSIDALSHTWSSLTDGAGRTLVSRDPLSKESTFEFDANSNLIKSRDANGVGQDCIFDDVNRDVSCTDTQGDTTSRQYDANSNVTQVTDAKGNNITNVYDARNRLTKITDRVSGETKYRYDANNNLIQIEDADSVAGSKDVFTLYEYDVRNLLIHTAYPGHPYSGTPYVDDLVIDHVLAIGASNCDKVSYEYDAARRKEVCIDQRGDKVTYKYDLVSRLTDRIYRLFSALTDESTDTFHHDKASRLTMSTKGRYGTTCLYTYDEASRMLTEKIELDLNGESYETEYEYDAANRITEIEYPDDRLLTLSYSDRNEVLTRTFDSVLVATHEYDDGYRETKRTHGNGLITEFEYNRSDNLKTDIKVFESDGITSIDDLTFSYAYDQNKNLTREDRSGLLSGTSFDAQYDAEDRVTQWDRDNLTESQDWTLSLVGDWDSTTINGVAQSRSHNEVHELTGIGANSLSYDAKGNLITDENDQEYIWDIDNHLSEALDTNDNTIATFGYDASGRRVYKTVGGTTTVFICQGQQVVCEYDSLSAVTAPSRTYVYGNYIDEPLMTVDGLGNKHYYHQNRQFNVIGLTDDAVAPAITDLFAYKTYGEVSYYDATGTVQVSPSVDQSYEFTGRRKDGETGLYYFRARYYSDTQGRFISRDPIGYVDGMSLYTGYAFQGFSLDPMGLHDINLVNQAIKQVTALIAHLEAGGTVASYKGSTTGLVKFFGEAATKEFDVKRLKRTLDTLKKIKRGIKAGRWVKRGGAGGCYSRCTNVDI